MQVLKNIHTIWVSDNGYVPDQVISNLIAWREMLPSNWRLYLWTNRNEINEQYLAHLANYCTILEVQDVMAKIPEFIQDKLKFFLANSSKLNYLFARLFSDIFRLLLMTIEDKEQIFSGIYIDAGDTFFSEHTRNKLETLDLPHGFAFRIEWKEFDSNVTIFSPISAAKNNTNSARQILAAYFHRLANWQIEHLQQLEEDWKFTAITNIKKLFGYDYTLDKVTTAIGHKFPMAEIDATYLLGLKYSNSMDCMLKYDKLNLTYNLLNEIKQCTYIARPLKFPTISQFTCNIPCYNCHYPIPMSDPVAEI